jgi:hypothetical protein
MSTKKKRRRPSTRPPGTQGAPPSAERSEAGSARRDRKESVRRAREAERKRAGRVAALRRAIAFSLIGLATLFLVTHFLKAPHARPIPAAAVTAAETAGCSGVATPAVDPEPGLHLQPNEAYTYSQHPATSGWHDPSPLGLSTHVYTAPVPETKAVHNLEHSEILLYYRPDGQGALAPEVVAALANVANQSRNTILAPYRDLPSGTSLALAAWNKLQTCPATITKDQASAVAIGFEYAFSCTGNAPEPKVSGNGC